MRTPTFSHAAWFAAGAIAGGVAAGFLPSHPATGNSSVFNKSVAALPQKPNVSNPAQSAANPDPESALRRAMTSPPGLPRSRDFLTFVEAVDAGNWQSAWERFASAIKGKEGVHELDTKLLLTRIGEIAGEAGVAWFSKAGKTNQANDVMTAWASVDPQKARQWVMASPRAGDLCPALIKGTGLHSIASLLEFAGSGQTWALNNYGRDLIAAARLKGTPAEGEQLWRKFLEVAEEEDPKTAAILKETSGSFVMFNELTTWQVESAKANGSPAAARDWLSGIIAEGYRMGEDNLSAVGGAATETDPEGTLQWASEMARAFSEGDPVQLQRITRQQGFAAAKQWAKNDASALAQWLSARPGHLAYDTGAAALYLALKDTDPSGAAAWGAEVRDGSLRQWTHLDPPPSPPPTPAPLPMQ